MGMMWYGSSQRVWLIDDRLLTHLQVVILNKLRRQECFAFSVTDDTYGRETVWMSPNVPVRFEFIEPAEMQINPEWIRVLAAAAESRDGLRPIPEPPHVARSVTPPVRQLAEADR